MVIILSATKLFFANNLASLFRYSHKLKLSITYITQPSIQHGFALYNP